MQIRVFGFLHTLLQFAWLFNKSLRKTSEINKYMALIILCMNLVQLCRLHIIWKRTLYMNLLLLFIKFLFIISSKI